MAIVRNVTKRITSAVVTNITGELPSGSLPAPIPASLVLQLDASDASTIQTEPGSIITQWLDKSTSSNNATQSTSTAKPLLVQSAQNGLSVARFDGVGDFMNINEALLPLGTSPRSIFIAFRGTGDQSLFGYGTTSPNDVARRYSIAVSNTEVSVAVGSGKYGRINLPSNSGFKQVGFWTTGTTISSVDMSRNGVNFNSILLAGTDRTLATAATTPNNFGFVGRAEELSFFNGDIGEILVYDKELNLSERGEVYSYLSLKWGI